MSFYDKQRPAPLVTIIGSMRYLEKMDQLSEMLTLSGYLSMYSRISCVPVPGKDTVQDNLILEQDGDRLTKLSFARIDRSDFVLLVGPYVGQDTTREVDYCLENNRTIYDVTPFFAMLESSGKTYMEYPTCWWIDRENLRVYTRFDKSPLMMLHPKEKKRGTVL